MSKTAPSIGPTDAEPSTEFVHTAFTKAGLVVDEGRPLKLHCTVLNTIYRKPRGKSRQPFSFRSIVNSRAVQAFTVDAAGQSLSAAAEGQNTTPVRGPVRVSLGEWDVDEIHICEMGSWGPEGEYICVGRCALT